MFKRNLQRLLVTAFVVAALAPAVPAAATDTGQATIAMNGGGGPG